MRWRLAGVNWEGRRWEAAAAIRVLAGQVNAMSGMPHGADGTVASRTHDLNNPRSDHRPYPYDSPPPVNAVVRAIDIGDVDTARLARITEALRVSQDPRLKYVIHDRRYFSPRTSWQWATYSGPNPHASHIHVSTTPAGDTDGTLFQLTPEEDTEMVKTGDKGLHVKRWQGWLIELNALAKGEDDGIFGAKTEAAVKKIQSFPDVGLDPTGIIDLSTGSVIVERLDNLRMTRHAKTPHAGEHEHPHRHSFEVPASSGETDAMTEA